MTVVVPSPLAAPTMEPVARPDPSAARPSPAKARLAGIEVLRTLACLAVVWAHSGMPPGFELAIAGVMTFTTISVAFTVHGRPSTLKADLLSRVSRYLMPWLFWSAVFAAAKVAEAMVTHRPIGGEFKLSMLLSGTSLHLWYLPFAMVVTSLVSIAAREGLIRPTRAQWVIWLTVSFAMLPAMAWVIEHSSEYGAVPQWAMGAPAIPIGLALSQLAPGQPGSGGRLLMVFAVVAASAVFTYYCGYNRMALGYVIGAGACAVAWGLPFKAGLVVSTLGTLSYGVYLVHPLVSRGLSRALGEVSPLTDFLVTTVLSIAAVLIMRQTWLRRVT